MIAKKRVHIERISLNPDRKDSVARLFTQIFAYTASGQEYPSHPHRACFYADIRDGNYVIYGINRLESDLVIPEIFRCLPVATTSEKNVRKTFRRIVRRTARKYAESRGIAPSQIEDYSSEYF